MSDQVTVSVCAGGDTCGNCYRCLAARLEKERDRYFQAVQMLAAGDIFVSFKDGFWYYQLGDTYQPMYGEYAYSYEAALAAADHITREAESMQAAIGETKKPLVIGPDDEPCAVTYSIACSDEQECGECWFCRCKKVLARPDIRELIAKHIEVFHSPGHNWSYLVGPYAVVSYSGYQHDFTAGLAALADMIDKYVTC